MAIQTLTWTKDTVQTPTWQKLSSGNLLYDDMFTTYDSSTVTYDGLYEQSATWTKNNPTTLTWNKNY